MNGWVQVGDQPVHVHAPAPTRTKIQTDAHCKGVCRDGRQCGGRWILWKHYDWYGWGGSCYHCGAGFGEGGHVGHLGHAAIMRVRAEFDRLLAQQ